MVPKREQDYEVSLRFGSSAPVRWPAPTEVSQHTVAGRPESPALGRDERVSIDLPFEQAMRGFLDTPRDE